MPISQEAITQESWEDAQIQFITDSNLPWELLRHPGFCNLISMAQRMTSQPELLTPRTAQRRVSSGIISRQEEVLKTLPTDGKISLALDCWTSPFMDAFMAITAYFIDDQWNFREMLLGFEPLHGTHSGANLSVVVTDLLKKHQLTDRVLAITADNASNNNTLMANIQDCLEALELSEDTAVIRVPCLAHVIQLSLKKLLGEMKAVPKNDVAEKGWDDTGSTRPRHKKGEIIETLDKVCYYPHLKVFH